MIFERFGKAEKPSEKAVEKPVGKILEAAGKEQEKIGKMAPHERVLYELYRQENPELRFNMWEEFRKKLIEKFYPEGLADDIRRLDEITKFGAGEQVRPDRAEQEETLNLGVKIDIGKKEAELALEKKLKEVFSGDNPPLTINTIKELLDKKAEAEKTNKTLEAKE